MSIYKLTPEDELLFDSLKNLPPSKALWESLEPICSWDDFGGFAGRTHTDETKARMSQAHTGKTFSAETRAKLSAVSKARVTTDETRAKLSAVSKARPRTPESNEKRSRALKGKQLPTMTCPHCGKVGSHGNIHRWHLDNCKQINK